MHRSWYWLWIGTDLSESDRSRSSEESVTDLALIRHYAPSFVLSNAATTHSHICTKQWSHSAADYYVTYHGPRPTRQAVALRNTLHTCSGQRVGVKCFNNMPPTFCSLPAWNWAVNTSGGYRISKRESQGQTPKTRGSRHRRRRGGSACYWVRWQCPSQKKNFWI